MTSTYDDGESETEGDPVEFDNEKISILQDQVDDIHSIENPVKKEQAVKDWVDKLNG